LDGEEQQPKLESIHSMTTAEWRAKYEKDGTVDLWVEEEFNAGSRLVVSGQLPSAILRKN
jgi:ferredoxin